MKCPRCQKQRPTSQNFCGACGTPLARVEGDTPPALSYADVQRSLSEALEQQAASSEILRLISTSPTDVQRVFDAIVQHAARLCDAAFSGLALVDGERLTLPAAHGLETAAHEAFLAPFPIRLGRDTVSGRAILEARVVHVRDQAAEPEYGGTPGQRVGTRSIVAVPMLRGGRAIGAITAWRRDVRPFTDAQIGLLQTFAAQAVNAIENVRLFKELEARNRDLTEAHKQVAGALEQQTATSEILRTIAHTQKDVQPVFDAIVRNAAQLCHAAIAGIFLTDGRMVYHPANYGSSPEASAAIRARFPRPLDMQSSAGMAILTRAVVHVPDIEEPTAPAMAREAGRLLGFRSMVTVPMLREGEAVGAITVDRRDPGRFSGAEVELLKTFADQAVIAIENVRLFKELENPQSGSQRGAGAADGHGRDPANHQHLPDGSPARAGYRGHERRALLRSLRRRLVAS